MGTSQNRSEKMGLARIGCRFAGKYAYWEVGGENRLQAFEAETGMEWMNAIQKSITYMEEHLLEEINYEDVAESVHISCYEFHRAFSFLAGMTANTYIRNRRLSLAGMEVVGSDTKITDIALKYGYDTSESFMELIRCLSLIQIIRQTDL